MSTIYGPSELDQSFTGTDSAFAIKTSTDNYAIGQSYTAGKTGTVDRAIFKLEKLGTPTGTGTCTLHADDGTSPTGAALSTAATVDVTTITTDDGGAEVTLQFPNDFEQKAGTKYWLKLTGSYAESGANYIQNRIDGGTAYGSGNRNRMNSSNEWLDDQGTADMYFKVYIKPKLGETGGNDGYLEV